MGSYQLFRAFLLSEGCEEAFDRAFKFFNGYTLLDERLWDTTDAEHIFGHAFDWSATPEGRDYWLSIDRAWNRALRQHHTMGLKSG